MSTNSATILITKLGAGERQLNAAIRMVLANEDELAIHTVAAAAYRVLRDIKEKRGRSDEHDLFMRGLFSVAHDLAIGKADSIPDVFAYPGSPLIGVIKSMRDEIVAGKIRNFEDMPPAQVKDENKFWTKFNDPANFLKHAKTDSERALDLNTINNEELLMRAAAVFFEITRRVTPEIEAYYIFAFSDSDSSGLPEEIMREFCNLTQTQKRKRCLAWLRRRKVSGTLQVVPRG